LTPDPDGAGEVAKAASGMPERTVPRQKMALKRRQHQAADDRTSDSRDALLMQFSPEFKSDGPQDQSRIIRVDGAIERLGDGAVRQRKGPKIEHRPSAPARFSLASQTSAEAGHQHACAGSHP